MSRNNFGVSFRGKKIIHPGAYDYQDGSATTRVSTDSFNLPIVIGTADTGKPGELMWFKGIEEARTHLSGGELLTALEMMYSPIPEGAGGASTIGVIVANENTRAKVVSGGITFEAKSYGKAGNNIQVKVEEGSEEESKKVTVYQWDKGRVEIYDNLGTVLDLQYVGDSAYADVSIVTSGESNRLTTRIGTTSEDAQIDLDIELADERFDTIGKLSSFFSSTSGYTATLVEAGNANLSSMTLEKVEKKEIKDNKSHLLALSGDIMLRINDYSNLVEITKVETVTVAEDYVNLVGGTQGAAPLSWVDYLALCKHTFSDILVLLSSDESIHAQGLAHIEEMEQRGHRRTLFTGGGALETPQQAIRRARVLSNSRAILAYPGCYSRSSGGGKTPLPAYMTSALLAGRVCGVDPAEPITFDHVSLVGLTQDLIVGDPVIDDLLEAGVCTLEKVQNGGIRIVQGITTSTSTDNPVYREISVRRSTDRVSADVRRDLESSFVGTKGLTTTETSVKTVVIDRLDRAIRDELIAAYDPNSITVRFMESVVYVDYLVAPVDPINFILITSRFVPSSQI